MLIEKRLTSGAAVRDLCIKHNYYTRGNNAEYSRLLALADDCGATGTTAADIDCMARDIFAHSNVERMRREYGEDDSAILCNIAFNLCREAIYSIFEEA